MAKKRYYACHLFAYPKVKFELSITETEPPYINIFCPGHFTIFLGPDQARALEEQLQLAVRLLDPDFPEKGGD